MFCMKHNSEFKLFIIWGFQAGYVMLIILLLDMNDCKNVSLYCCVTKYTDLSMSVQLCNKKVRVPEISAHNLIKQNLRRLLFSVLI